MYEKVGVLTGKEVVEMVDKWGGGISIAAVERHYGANESTICFFGGGKKQRQDQQQR